MREVLLQQAAGGKAFYNTSKYTFERLLDDPDNIEANFRDYLNGFSENVQDIIEKFKFDAHHHDGKQGDFVHCYQGIYQPKSESSFRCDF